MLESMETPRMSAYSDRDPPSENAFSLPPISLKLSPSPSDMEIGTEAASSRTSRAGNSLPSELPSHYSSRASSFMFSRRSSRMSTVNSPTKFPTISKSQSVSSLNTTRSLLGMGGGGGGGNKSNREFHRHNTLNATARDMSKSPSCPQLNGIDGLPHWEDEYDEDIESSASATDEKKKSSMVHASTKINYENDNDMKLPSIFSSNGKSKNKGKRDSSLPRLDASGSLTDREATRNSKGNHNKFNRDSMPLEFVASDINEMLTTPRINSDYSTTKPELAPSAFLVPITEIERSAALAQNQALPSNKNRKKKKVSPKASTRDNSLINNLATQQQYSDNGHKWGIDEEDENMDRLASTGTTNDGLTAIEEIAKENKASDNTNTSTNAVVAAANATIVVIPNRPAAVGSHEGKSQKKNHKSKKR